MGCVFVFVFEAQLVGWSPGSCRRKFKVRLQSKVRVPGPKVESFGFRIGDRAAKALVPAIYNLKYHLMGCRAA